MTAASRRVVGGLGVAALVAALSAVPLPALVASIAAMSIAAAPVLGLAAAALAVPFQGPWAVPLGVGDLTLAPIALAGAAYGWVLGDLSRRRLPHLPVGGIRWVLAPLGLFLAASAVSGLRAPDLGRALVETARWVELGLAAVLAASLARSPRRLWALVTVLLIAGVLEAIIGMRGAGAGVGPESFALVGGGAIRAFGTFGQPNPFGAYMNLVWPIGGALLATWLARDRLPRWLLPIAAVAAGACGAALVLSWSRGAWLGAAAAAAAMGAVWLAGAIRPPLEARYSGAALVIAIVVLAAIAAGPVSGVPSAIARRAAGASQGIADWDVADAEVNDDSFATVERVAHWQAAIAMWREAPWLGQGPGQYEPAYPRFRLPRWPDALGHAHNHYLHVLAEGGALGLSAFLLLMAGALAFALRSAWRPTTAAQAALGLALVGVLSATLVHSLVDNVFVHDMPIHLGLLIGVVAAAGDVG